MARLARRPRGDRLSQVEAHGIIRRGVESAQRALSEFESKRLLAAYGLPVVREVLAAGEDEAVRAAESLGFPVVVKACAPDLMHKTESGLVALGLTDDAAVRTAHREITHRATSQLDGVLVQEMVSGQRELMVGMIRDLQFGPCVMAGLGGILTEVLGDTAFRMAPVNTVDALDMIEELRCRAMLEAFRGQGAADLEVVARCVIAVGDIGLAHPEVSEIDVNPLIIDTRGGVRAVDALVVLGRSDGDA
jgi:succinyl-CoA synthetase beta subunit